jgi:hypothetical protein
MGRDVTSLVIATGLLAGCYSMAFSGYNGDADRADSPGGVDAGGPRSDAVAPGIDVALAADLAGTGGPDPIATDGGSESLAILCSNGTEPVFKDDFDSGSLSTAGWGSGFIGGGMFTLDPTTSQSPPASALRSFPDLAAGSSVCSADLAKTFSAPHAPTVHLEFDVRVSSNCVQFVWPAPAMPPVLATLRPASGYSLTIRVGADPTTVYIREFDTAGNTYAAAAQQSLSIDEWLHVDLQVRFSGRPLGALSIGGRTPQSFVVHPLKSAALGDQIASLSLGDARGSPSSACDVSYDNVSFSMPAACPN